MNYSVTAHKEKWGEGRGGRGPDRIHSTDYNRDQPAEEAANGGVRLVGTIRQFVSWDR